MQRDREAGNTDNLTELLTINKNLSANSEINFTSKMKREITVKAFNSRTKHWLYFSIGQQWSNLQQELYSELCLNGAVFYQFTGLNDKHGKEIYEGDILHSESWCNSTIKTNPYHVVEWKGIGWKAKGYNGTMQVSPDLDVKSDFEIIGNIHQDENLLK